MNNIVLLLLTILAIIIYKFPKHFIESCHFCKKNRSMLMHTR